MDVAAAGARPFAVRRLDIGGGAPPAPPTGNLYHRLAGETPHLKEGVELLVVLHNYMNPFADITFSNRHEIGVAAVVVVKADEKPSIFHGKLSIKLGAPTVKVRETEV